jgi:vitamin B12 transporter
MKTGLSITALAVACAFPPGACADTLGETIVVTATRQASRTDELLADVSVVTREEIAAFGQSTLAELLATLPGLQRTANGGPGQIAGIFMRGANTEHTLVLVDGVRIGSATSGAAALERIPLDQIERIEVLRGPSSALYGADAIGGVIQIFTRRGKGPASVDLYAGAGSWQTRDVAAGVSGGSEAWSYALRGGYYDTDGINASTRKNPFAFEPDRDAFRNASASGSLAFRPAEGHEIGATALYTEGRNRYDEGVAGFSPYNDVAQSAYSLYSRNRLTAAWTSTLRLGRSQDYYRNFSPYNAGDGYFDIETTQDQLVWQNDIQLPLGSLLAALETLQQKGESEGNFDKSRRINSALLGWSGQLGTHFFQANVRRDDNSQFGDKTSGALSYGYQLSPELRLRAAVGSAFRAPSLNDLYYPLQCFGAFGCFGGNPDLKPERAHSKEVGLVWEQPRRRAALTVYDSRVKDLIVWGNTPENVARARLTGATLSDEGQFGAYKLGMAIDWLDARDADTDKRLRRRARWQGTFHAARELGAWTLGGEWQLVSGRYEDASEMQRMGGYGLVNLFARYAVAREWTLEARANNVGDKQYESALGFATPGANAFFAVRYAPK